MSASRRNKKWESVTTAVFVVSFGFVCVAATTDNLSGPAAKVTEDLRSRNPSTPQRKASPIHFFIDEARATMTFVETDADTPVKTTLNDRTISINKTYQIEVAKLKSSTSSTQNGLQKNLESARKALFALRSDCIKKDMPLDSRNAQLDEFNDLLTASHWSLQDDCLNAQSLHIHNKDRLQIEAQALSSYNDYKASSHEEYDMAALDKLEKSYLSFLHLAITERSQGLKEDYYFIAGFLGLKLWSFNKDDAALLPLLVLSAESSSSTTHAAAWLLLKDHLHFSYSGSAGEHVPRFWNDVLISTSKK